MGCFHYFFLGDILDCSMLYCFLSSGGIHLCESAPFVLTNHISYTYRTHLSKSHLILNTVSINRQIHSGLPSQRSRVKVQSSSNQSKNKLSCGKKSLDPKNNIRSRKILQSTLNENQHVSNDVLYH